MIALSHVSNALRRSRASARAVLPAAVFVFAGLAPHAAGSHAAGPPALPALQVDLSQTSVSGISSGAYMAGQFAVAYSGTVIGAGLVAGGPYYCSGTIGVAPFIAYLNTATSTCMNPAGAFVAPPDAGASWSAAQTFAQYGLIDATGNVARQRIYLFSGSDDQTVTRPVVDQAARFYQLAGVPAENIRYVTSYDAGHAFITDLKTDQACPKTAPPYINDCDYAQAREILAHLYQNLQPPSARLSGKLVKFNQSAYVRNAYSSMSSTGYVYVPSACTSQTCRVHVAFHGCEQGVKAIGDHFYAHAGYNETADSNRIVVLYPQVEPSPGQFSPYNPKGCWDFWGYTSFNPFYPDFYTKGGTQMAAVKAMLDRLAMPRAAP